MTQKQKHLFLESEGDAWHDRNLEALSQKDYGDDEITKVVAELCDAKQYINGKIKILEVGCGSGGRLNWLARNAGVEVCGIDPSSRAVEQAVQLEIPVVKGTADNLPFESGSIDIIVYGFCLYLCDQTDLFQIAKEADRVLRSEAWVVIRDFYSDSSLRVPYHHREGVLSHKMDYGRLFDWHPFYTRYFHRVSDHSSGNYTDEEGNWVATTILRKRNS
jgi:ubiquinone/menaquinone biosynthesis C-methylase UbiE